jgi:aminoglycoside 6'-N-acetyltransferase I
MKTRPLTEQDKASWIRMRTALWPDSSEHIQSEVEDFFTGHSKIISQVILAETDNKEIIGFIELNLRAYAPGSAESTVPFVEGWYVMDAYRGLGVGRKLMQAAEQWALNLGFSELGSDALATNQASISAHKKLGFDEIERTVCFLKVLDSP